LSTTSRWSTAPCRGGQERSTPIVGLAVDLVAWDLGVTFLPAGAVPDDGRVVRVPVADAPAWTVGIAHSARRRSSAAVLALIDQLRAEVPGHTGAEWVREGIDRAPDHRPVDQRHSRFEG
jgi:DNA-binding transcriptional LysR family regulator